MARSFIGIQGEYFYELLPGFFMAFITIPGVSPVAEKPSEAVMKKFDGTGGIDVKDEFICEK